MVYRAGGELSGSLRMIRLFRQHRMLLVMVYLLLMGLILLLPVAMGGVVSGLFGYAIWDMGHLVLGGGLALVLAQLRGLRAVSRSRQWAVIVIATLLLALAFELLQLLVGRSSSAKDVVSTGAGALLWLCMAQRPWPFHGTAKRLLTALLVASLLVPLGPLCWALYVRLSAANSFPVLADFASPAYRGQWNADDLLYLQRIESPADPNSQALQITLDDSRFERRDAARYQIVRFTEFPSDWSDYDYLELSLHAEESLAVILIVADLEYQMKRTYDRSNRFAMTLDLKPGANYFRLQNKAWLVTSGGRVMDSRQIRQMHFVVKTMPDSGRQFVVNSIALSRQDP